MAVGGHTALLGHLARVLEDELGVRVADMPGDQLTEVVDALDAVIGRACWFCWRGVQHPD